MVTMFNVKEVGVGVASLASAVAVGYCYLRKREGRQKALLKAMEDINQVFTRERSQWEETKDKVVERLLSQEEKVKDMEEERRARDDRLLGMERRLGELEAAEEKRRTCREEERRAEEETNESTIAALQEELRREREEKREERLRLLREREALAEEWEEERLRLVGEQEALVERFLYAQRQTQSRALETEEKTRRLEEEEKEKKKLRLISAGCDDVADAADAANETRADGVLLCPSSTEDSTESVRPAAPDDWATRYCELTLDPNTAHRNLLLSEDNRAATRVDGSLRPSCPPDHPDRFDFCRQVLCAEALTGRCYWEVDWSGSVSVAVTYGGISRRGRGDNGLFGHYNKSWSLDCYQVPPGSGCKVPDCLKVCHDGKPTILWTQQDSSSSSSVRPSCPGRVGVYLDWPAGTLSFYGVWADARTHLYTFRCRFTEPLYAGFGFRPYSWSDSSVSLRQIEVQ